MFTKCKHRYVQFSREVNIEDVRQKRLKFMPGFRFIWYFTGVEPPVGQISFREISKAFVRNFIAYLMITVYLHMFSYIFYI